MITSSTVFTCPAFTMDLQGQTLTLESDLQLVGGDVCVLFAESDNLVQGFLYLLAGLHRSRRLTTPSVSGYGRTVTETEVPDVNLAGVPIYSLSERERASRLAVIYQNPEVAIIGRTVIDEFEYSFCALDRPHSISSANLDLELYGLQYKLDRSTDVLSGGERHRLNCACALEIRPNVIIADFTSSNLDSDFFDEFLKNLGGYAKKGHIVIVSGVRADQVTLLSSSPKYLALEPTTRTFRTVDAAPPWAPTATQEAAQVLANLDTRPVGDVFFEARDISVRPRTQSPFSAAVREGEILVCTAPNGFGKTTVGNVIANRLRPTDGVVKTELKSTTLAIQHPERSFLFTTVRETLLGNDDLAAFCGFSREDLASHPRELSPARQKLLCVAAALDRSDGVAVLDEPTCGMDTKAKESFAKLVSRFPKLGIIIFTHDPVLSDVGNKINWS